MSKKVEIIWSVLRLLLGWIFLWAFLDKTFGLGFATEAGKGWLDGGAPTYGFLAHATKGPFAEFYQAMAGSALVEWLFMLGLLFIGVTLCLGVMVRLGALAGVVLYVLFYTAGFMPPEHNPVVDDHVINAVLLLGIYFTVPSRYLGFGKKWRQTRLVRRFPLLT